MTEIVSGANGDVPMIDEVINAARQPRQCS